MKDLLLKLTLIVSVSFCFLWHLSARLISRIASYAPPKKRPHRTVRCGLKLIYDMSVILLHEHFCDLTVNYHSIDTGSDCKFAIAAIDSNGLTGSVID